MDNEQVIFCDGKIIRLADFNKFDKTEAKRERSVQITSDGQGFYKLVSCGGVWAYDVTRLWNIKYKY